MYEFLDYRVCDAMTADPVTITPDLPLARVEEIFSQHDFNALPVVDASGALVGVVTKLDVLKAFRFTDEHMFPPYEQIMTQPAGEVMTRDVATVTPRMPLTRLLQRMLDTRNKSFPVVDGARLVGVVAREDVLNALRRAAAGEKATGAI
jgi:CBS domain-containing protein